MKKLILIGIILLITSLFAYGQQTPPQNNKGLIDDIGIPTSAGGGGLFGAIFTYLVLYFKGKKNEESLLLGKMQQCLDKQEESNKQVEKIGDCLMALRDSHSKKYQDENIPSPK